ncbi:unnamed protein product [Calicophoron daubneyi]|uniref:Uncharacterized protein n=1 Tax=Calicophoron daubneyi TaxID=300641 RepID=A0AAV2U0G9_CALDB
MFTRVLLQASDFQLSQLDSSPPERSRSVRYGILLGCGLVVSSAVYVLSSFIAPAFRRVCLPYVPATPAQLDRVTRLLTIARQEKRLQSLGSVIDLGSGDGRVLLHLLTHPEVSFTRGFGVELNRPLVWYSRWNAYRSLGPKRKMISFCCGDMWKTNLTDYQTVVVFGVDSMLS